MITKKLLLTFVAGFIVMFALSGLWYLVIVKGFYSEQFAGVNRPEFNMVWITVGYLVAAILMAYVYPTGYKGGSPMKEGMKFGLIMGLLMALPISLVHLGVLNVQLTGSLVDTTIPSGGKNRRGDGYWSCLRKKCLVRKGRNSCFYLILVRSLS